MPDTQTVHEIEPAAHQNCIMQRTLGPARGINSVRVCLTDGNWRQRELFYEMEDRLEGAVDGRCIDILYRLADLLTICAKVSGHFYVPLEAIIALVEGGHEGGDGFALPCAQRRFVPHDRLAEIVHRFADPRIQAPKLAYAGIVRQGWKVRQFRPL